MSRARRFGFPRPPPSAQPAPPSPSLSYSRLPPILSSTRLSPSPPCTSPPLSSSRLSPSLPSLPRPYSSLPSRPYSRFPRVSSFRPPLISSSHSSTISSFFPPLPHFSTEPDSGLRLPARTYAASRFGRSARHTEQSTTSGYDDEELSFSMRPEPSIPSELQIPDIQSYLQTQKPIQSVDAPSTELATTTELKSLYVPKEDWKPKEDCKSKKNSNPKKNSKPKGVSKPKEDSKPKPPKVFRWVKQKEVDSEFLLGLSSKPRSPRLKITRTVLPAPLPDTLAAASKFIRAYLRPSEDQRQDTEQIRQSMYQWLSKKLQDMGDEADKSDVLFVYHFGLSKPTDRVQVRWLLHQDPRPQWFMPDDSYWTIPASHPVWEYIPRVNDLGKVEQSTPIRDRWIKESEGPSDLLKDISDLSLPSFAGSAFIDLPGNITQEPTSEVNSDMTTGISPVVSIGVTQEVASEATSKVAQEAPEEVPKIAPKVITKESPKESPKEAPKEVMPIEKMLALPPESSLSSGWSAFSVTEYLTSGSLSERSQSASSLLGIFRKGDEYINTSLVMKALDKIQETTCRVFGKISRTGQKLYGAVERWYRRRQTKPDEPKTRHQMSPSTKNHPKQVAEGVESASELSIVKGFLPPRPPTPPEPPVSESWLAKQREMWRFHPWNWL